jgi:predicted transcriptional regulator
VAPQGAASVSQDVPPATGAPRATSKTPHGSAEAEPPLGEALTRRRDALGISREALAAASGLSWGFITEVERGRRRDPRSRQRLSEAIEALGKQLREQRG